MKESDEQPPLIKAITISNPRMPSKRIFYLLPILLPMITHDTSVPLLLNNITPPLTRLLQRSTTAHSKRC
jgi:hypothetical protein